MADILFFGRLSGLRASGPEAPTDSRAFRRALEARFPELADPGVRMVVNQVMVATEPVPIAPGDEIAFLAPMSGG